MSHQYRGPGKYIAICIKMNHKGHYCKEFSVPDEEQYRDVLASWYFLNAEDGVAYLEAVYPLDVFLPLTNRAYSDGVDAGVTESCKKQDEERVVRHKDLEHLKQSILDAQDYLRRVKDAQDYSYLQAGGVVVAEELEPVLNEVRDTILDVVEILRANAETGVTVAGKESGKE